MRLDKAIFSSIVEYVGRFQASEDLELEVGFRKGVHDKPSFMSVYEYMSSNEQFVRETDEADTLDLLFDDGIRASILGKEAIQTYCVTNVVPGSLHVIRKSEISGVPKIRVDDYGFVVRLKEEVPVENVAETMRERLHTPRNFRYKRRSSFLSTDGRVRVDMTIVKQSDAPSPTLADSSTKYDDESYEVEIELLRPEGGVSPEGAAEALVVTTDIVLQVTRDTCDVLGETVRLSVIKQYLDLVHPAHRLTPERIRVTNPRDLFLTYQPVTLERANLRAPDLGTVSVTEHYTVTDKTDGERMLLYIADEGEVYMIDNRLSVRATGTTAPKDLARSLLDGERVRRGKFGEPCDLFMVFDIYFLSGTDVRNTPLIADDHGEKKAAKASRYAHLRAVTARLKKGDTEILPKTFLHGQSLEAMCNKIYRETVYPYHIDGLIFTPTRHFVGSDYLNEESRGTNAPFGGTWHQVFKWKPPSENTIDMLITYGERTVSHTHGACYVCDLGVAYRASTDARVDAMAILKHAYRHKAHSKDYVNKRFAVTHLPVNDSGGLPRAKNGEVVYTNTVVEFYYDPHALENARWVPLRVRHDKTRHLHRTKKVLGACNSHTTATNVWRSITVPVHLEHLTEPAARKKALESGWEKDAPAVYYARLGARESSLLRPMNMFHNSGVKTRLFQALRSAKVNNLVEFACGKGGDIYKWTNAGFSQVVGVDLYEDNLLNTNDGAYRRYHKLTQDRNPRHIPRMAFACQDLSKPWVSGGSCDHPQMRAIHDLLWGKTSRDAVSSDTLQGLHGVLTTPSDAVSCQFSIHYFFRDSDALHVFCKNLDRVLKKGGVFVGTCMNGQRVLDLLEASDNGTVVGKVHDNPMWMLRRKYDPDAVAEQGIQFGQKIDVYVETINQVLEEYLVDMPLLEEVLGTYGIRPASSETVALMGLDSHRGSFRDLHNQSTFPLTPDLARFSYLNEWFVYEKT